MSPHFTSATPTKQALCLRKARLFFHAHIGHVKDLTPEQQLRAENSLLTLWREHRRVMGWKHPAETIEFARNIMARV